MAPKPRVFTAPDGKQFSSKPEYRDYLMATFYSWKDKKEGEWIKSPGEIDGQVFDIGDSSGATFVVMDRTEQVQIDRLTNCKVFLGCCSSSIFIRDCSECEFYTCCRQLRLRGVTNSKFFVYSQAEVHIEESEEVSFAPFNGGYSEQKDHFAAAGMTCDNNLWYDIFDHNDPDKTGAHWSLIPESEYGEPWWPAGNKGTPYVPITEAGTVQKVGEEGSNKDAAQAGKAYSMEDMRAQAAVQAMEEMNHAVEAMNMECALLVMSALGKGIDLSVWFMEGEEVSVEDFNDKFQHLALTLGVGEDWETKQELDLAVSSKSLAQIATLFGKSSRKGVKCIDVSMFLNCSKQKVSAYLATMDGGDEEVQTENSGSPSTNKAIALSVSATTINSGSSGASAMGDSVSQVSQINEDEEEVDDELVVQGELDADEVRLELGSVEARSPYATRALLPDSPYDEEVAFAVDDDDEVDTFDQRRRGGKKRPSSSPSGPGAVPPPAPSAMLTGGKGHSAPPPAPAATFTSTSAPAPAVQRPKTVPRERPVITAPGPRKIRANSPEKIQESRELAASRAAEVKRKSVPATPKTSGRMAIKGNEVRGGSFSRAPRSGLSPAKKRPVAPVADTRRTPLSTSMNLSEKENRGESSVAPNRSSVASAALLRQSTSSDAAATALSLTALVERKARQISQSSDLYHLVQVHLGFIEKYTLVPARGKIVPYKPRVWLSVADLQEAFLAARQHFSEAHVYALMKLVVSYAKDSGMETEEDGDSLFSGVKDLIKVDADGRKLHYLWLQKYLVHLRLTKPKPPLGATVEPSSTRVSRDAPLKFSEWLGSKKAEDAKDAGKKDREFRKALAGRKADLDSGDLDSMLTKNSIIPADSLKKYISLRVQAYVFDIDGRKDFTHDLHFSLRRWCDDNKQDFKRVSDPEVRKSVLMELKTKLLKGKAEELRDGESKGQSITKQLFAQYAKERKADNYGPAGKNWGSWLAGQIDDLEVLVKKSREVDAQRERLLVERTARKMEVAPLRLIEAKFDECCTMMKNQSHAIEIRKCLVRLRKKALEAGVGKTDNILVTKALFDQEMAFVLAPYMLELPEELRGLAEEARHSHMSVGQTFQVDKQFTDLIGNIFKQDQDSALKEGSVLKAAKEEEFASDFEGWKKRVAEKKQQAREAAAAHEEEKKREEEKKKKKADKAYRKWLRLRKGGKYVTKTAEGKKVVRPVPISNRVEHDARWSKDVEVEQAETSFL